MKRLILPAIAMIIAANSSAQSHQSLPEWLEVDSASAIEYRLAKDFTLPLTRLAQQIKEAYPEIDTAQMRQYIDDNYIETMVIGGVEYAHRKALRNFALLCPEVRGEWGGRGSDAAPKDIQLVDSIISMSAGDGTVVGDRRITYRFSIDVPRHDFLIGDTVKVWMPLPMESARQKNISVISSTPETYVVSTGKSCHNTLYFQLPVTNESDSVLHFEYVGQYTVSAQYFSPEYILSHIQPYDTTTALYRQYTSVELPHIVKNNLAREIVGDEKCPYRQSELIYDYIVTNYPWAGAREYSTIPSIPQYVLDEKHGDCGQVALLYISLMRTLGVPARWESGWMLHPGDQNLHDWAEVYFEGVGWVPVDASFGRYISSENAAVRDFYSTGMDYYRFATNLGVCEPLYPAKKFLRSETVDFQVGEVECSKGNLFYPGWKKRLEVIKTEIIK